MSDPILSKYFSEMGKKGGKARVKNMTEEQIKASARKAGLASAAKRKAKVAKKKKGNK